MQINTKFPIGESVWSILNGRAHGFEITGVDISKDSKGNTKISYRDGMFNSYPEHQCFLSKEELRDYFMGGE